MAAYQQFLKHIYWNFMESGISGIRFRIVNRYKIHWYVLQIKHLTASQKMPNLDKAFHSPEFQAKLFFTRHWVGGFYWDSLLIEHSMDKIYDLGPKNL